MDYRYDFSDNKGRKTKKLIFIVIFLVLVIMFVCFFLRNNSNSIVSKVSSVISSPINFIYNFLNLNEDKPDADIEKVRQENEVLRAENETLKYQVLESQKILDENTTYKQMLNIQKEYQHFELVMGNIIFREHDNWTQTFTINVGKNDGVELNDAVVHEKGLVGYISSVSDNTSVVTTILDASTSVSVNISTINEPAVINGDLELKSKNRLKLTYIPIDTEVAVSDMLYTSGIGVMYPASIPVGKIVEIVNNKSDVNRYAIVEPSVDISKIAEVAVIVN